MLILAHAKQFGINQPIVGLFEAVYHEWEWQQGRASMFVDGFHIYGNGG